VPPSGIASIAFKTRLLSARCSSSGSASSGIGLRRVRSERIESLSPAPSTSWPWRRGFRKAKARARQASLASMRSNSGLGILLKSLKRPMMVLRFAISMPSVAGALAEDLVKFGFRQSAGPHQILDGQLHGKERILEFMSQPPGQFAPRGHALALHQPLALAGRAGPVMWLKLRASTPSSSRPFPLR
jgi:hypothetical protein